MSDAVKTLKVSREGMILIKSFEGFRPRAVRDAAGRWTIGYGHALSAREGATVTEAEAELLLQYDLIPVVKLVNDRFAGRLNQHQFDAVASFALSVGPERFLASDVARRLETGAVGEAADALFAWPEPPAPEDALRRRAAERALFMADPGRAVTLADLMAAPLPPPRVGASGAGPQARAAAVAALLGEPAEAAAPSAPAPVEAPVVTPVFRLDPVEPPPQPVPEAVPETAPEIVPETVAEAPSEVTPEAEAQAEPAAEAQPAPKDEPPADPVAEPAAEAPVAPLVESSEERPVVTPAATPFSAPFARYSPYAAILTGPLPAIAPTPAASEPSTPEAAAPDAPAAAVGEDSGEGEDEPDTSPAPDAGDAGEAEAAGETEAPDDDDAPDEAPDTAEPFTLTPPDGTESEAVERTAWTETERAAAAAPQDVLFEDEPAGPAVLRHEQDDAPQRPDWSIAGAFLVMGGTGLVACAASAAAFRKAMVDSSGLGDYSLIGWVLAVIGGVCVAVSSLNLYQRLGRKTPA